MPPGQLRARGYVVGRRVLVYAVKKMSLDPRPCQRLHPPRRMSRGDDPRIADDQRPPSPHLRGQLPQRLDLARAKDDARSRLKVEGTHAARLVVSRWAAMVRGEPRLRRAATWETAA